MAAIQAIREQNILHEVLNGVKIEASQNKIEKNRAVFEFVKDNGANITLNLNLIRDV